MTNRTSVKEMTFIAMTTAVLCILAPFVLPLPFSPVPISLTNLILCFIVYILGQKKSLVAFLLYMLLGLVGLPVFSGFAGGVGKVFGPTGGYLLGFIFLILVSGFVVEKFPESRMIQVIGFIIGHFIVYAFGSIWLAVQAHMTLYQALLAGVIPFLIGDGVKVAIAVVAGPLMKKMIEKSAVLRC